MTNAKTARVLIVDDHPTVREGLSYRISAQPDMEVCGEAADVGEAMDKIGRLKPDVVIVDIALRESDGLDLIKTAGGRQNRIRAVVLSMYDEAVYAERCLHAGAMGYVNKTADPNDVIEAIRTVHAGRVYLSPGMSSRMLDRTVGGGHAPEDPVDALTDRQLEIFRLIGEGKTSADIADHLHISVHTVETHRNNIKRKLRVETGAELVRRAVLWGAQNR